MNKWHKYVITLDLHVCQNGLGLECNFSCGFNVGIGAGELISLSSHLRQRAVSNLLRLHA